MKKFKFRKSELMDNNEENNALLKEDGFISNGLIALKENFICINKNLNAEFYTLKSYGESKNLLLNPEWATLKDVLSINKKYSTEVKIAEKSNNFFTSIFINDKERRIEKSYLDRIMAINPEIKLYANDNSFLSTKLQIVLNNEVIGVIVAQS